MIVKYPPDFQRFKTMTTAELRDSFLLDSMFKPDKIILTYSHIDRAIVGSVVPVKSAIKLKTSDKEMRARFFAERREIGVINIGNTGSINVDKQKFELNNKDCLYIGKGSRSIEFFSSEKKKPAQFYLISYPAHQEYETKLVSYADADKVELGSQEEANKRIIYKMIHPQAVQSCQLVMGFTELAPGSVWNTMPAHTHERRSEIYMYFDLPKDAMVCHIMGKPDETRHIFARNGEAVISPSWSIHSGAGTSNYTFVWSMGGENQEFDDMDFVKQKYMK